MYTPSEHTLQRRSLLMIIRLRAFLLSGSSTFLRTDRSREELLQLVQKPGRAAGAPGARMPTDAFAGLVVLGFLVQPIGPILYHPFRREVVRSPDMMPDWVALSGQGWRGGTTPGWRSPTAN